ncbi:Glycine cleavage system transcriptional activator [Dickeya dianthicola]|uniref:LysR family transcriptional regulator n=1 Tax=Dickeya dianthicola TaxID=204039 RepID=A0AAP2D346_9GAMM|nr:LysR substrate-binding domain-containing protein [Dickeya dianthicola]ATO34943.1 Transcriptional regulator, LysR family [Dickeya dianthicola RNS04.9]AYC20762.1 Glycine cleavage system transcriptional activator [Dickeya dianthicola]MBI0439738.1 LysR family transcriptional regulator [Dickeya dianthicola]MBI0450338.1 LysR family transcriptional regulator [Dickeya dianthicola]MBI0454865.1 LysR family transcriptional regulator [Dickeya dianthicola]
MAGKLQLPPLQALVVFEAAARLGNFTAAGNELGLSQPAVSQRIQALENVVNSPLFERRHRGVQLTESGNSLYLIVRASLIEISEQLERTRHRRNVLRIDTDMGFASYWLLPRMERLQALIPGVEVQITTSPNDYNFRDSSADLAIYFGHGNWPGTQTQRLFPEIVFPVCNQPVKRELGENATPASLLNFPLLKLPDTRPQRWMTWEDWFRQHQVYGQNHTASRAFNAYSLVIQAALEGQGIALGWQPLIAPFLANKQLVQCGPMQRTDRGYYLISASAKPTSAQQEKIKAWLLDEAWSFQSSGQMMPEIK